MRLEERTQERLRATVWWVVILGLVIYLAWAFGEGWGAFIGSLAR